MEVSANQSYMTYDFITPSDSITFLADDDKVAFACGIMLGKGKTGCKRYQGTEEVDIETVMILDASPNKTIEEYLGCGLNQFVIENSKDVAKCFNSFAYGTISDRAEYNKACAAITDPKKLKRFKVDHGEDNRTSLATWVAGAWEYGEAIKKQFQI